MFINKKNNKQFMCILLKYRHSNCTCQHVFFHI